MRRLTPSDYRRMPWRNGGGTTTEIFIAPEGAALAGERFLYRVSIADVATDGPFSRFDGYDRHIMLLAGEGMTIDTGEHGVIELVTPLEPRSFSGDWDVTGTLVAGPVRDFNLMVDRSRASSSLEVRLVEEPMTIVCEPKTTCIVYVIAGELDAASEGDTIVAGASFEIRPRVPSRLAIGRVALTP